MRTLPQVVIGIVAIVLFAAIARAQDTSEAIESTPNIDASTHIDRLPAAAGHSYSAGQATKSLFRWPFSSAPGVWGPFAWGPHYGLGWAGWAGWSGWGPLYQPATVIGRMKVNLENPSKSELVWGDVTTKKRR
jgi:hypothetical protein